MLFASFPPSRRPQAGAALVVVLAILVIVFGMAIALLSIAKSERRSSSVFLANAETRQLADTAVGIVQSQINYATTRGATVAWASQPGMIRTYGTDGTLQSAYKLYSASSLTETDAASLNNDMPPSDWASSPGLWTDLNAPATSKGQRIFPIVDPDILETPSITPPLGFAIAGAPGSSAAQRAPMPVRWLYVLKDGQIVTPTGTGAQITVAGADPKTNPIIGRIAFWTDDDTCKVNVNTAGAGGYWDTPRFYTAEDRKFATSQPLNGEFQRYPGHPSMTSLSAIFPQLTDEQILSSITPRYQWGGSKQGTVDTYTQTQALNNGSLASAPLFSDSDEIAFKPSYSARAENPNLSRDLIARTRFFLTAVSQAPEVNLFNLPRVACWPVSTKTTGQSAFDRLISFVSSIGSYRYYFQRTSSLSPSADAGISRNQELFSYLQYLTNQTIPGFGVSLAGKFGSDRDQILTEIWDYIRCTNLYDSRLASDQFTPGNSSGTTGTGYGYVVPLKNGTSRGFGRSITLSELAFVFICTGDPVDTQNPSSPNPKGMQGSNDPATNPTLGGTALKPSSPSQRRIQMMVVPEFFSPSLGNIFIRPKYIRMSIKGLTSFTLDGQSLFSSDPGSLQLDDVLFNSGYHRRALGGTFDYRAALGSGSPAYPFISKYVTVSVPSPGNNNPGSMPFATGPLTVTLETSENGSNWTSSQIFTITPPTTANIPIPNLVRVATSGVTYAPATDVKHWWSFQANGSYSGRLSTLGKDPGSFRIFQDVPFAILTGPQGGTLLREAENLGYYTDVVRSMVVAHGDLRLISGLSTVPSEAFEPLGNWSATGATNALMHTLTTGTPSAYYIPGGSQNRRHFATANPIGKESTPGAGGIAPPDFPRTASSSILNALAASGDFDTGLSFWPDGAYINKPDEGNVFNSGSAVPYFTNAESELQNSAGFFSPNRLVSGPGMFGSLPTHVNRYAADPSHPERYAWRTLLFRKQPGHPNESAVSSGGLPQSLAPDHLLMDLFWMPTVEPYAISEPFSTAGKINMNYQIQPFTYITRKTGMYSVLLREKIAAAAVSDAGRYKDSSSTLSSLRITIDPQKTLEQFDSRFSDASGRLFLSPTELCDLWLVPTGETVSSMQAFWNAHTLTGDNVRERPYANIIPRLTTKSNSFTVYYRVQSLQTPPTATAGKWDESKGIISGEYRGSTSLQRFIDLSNTTLLSTDFAVNTASKPTLDKFYRWRVLATKQFAP